MASLYYKVYKALAKDASNNPIQIGEGVLQQGKHTIPDSSTSTGVAITAIDSRAKIIKLKADADCQYYISSPLKTADGNAALLFNGETEYECVNDASNNTYALTVITKQ
jgi:hypothetical protein